MKPPTFVLLDVFGDIDAVLAKIGPYISNRTLCASLSIPRDPRIVEVRRPAMTVTRAPSLVAMP